MGCHLLSMLSAPHWTVLLDALAHRYIPCISDLLAGSELGLAAVPYLHTSKRSSRSLCPFLEGWLAACSGNLPCEAWSGSMRPQWV